MMAGLFFIFFIAMIFISFGWRIPAMVAIIINLFLSLWMFLHHMALGGNINL